MVNYNTFSIFHALQYFQIIIDIEWGAFGDNGVLDFIKTPYDRQVDNNSVQVNSFT